jgi:hypothetical protein
MVKDMQLRGFSERTQETYLREVRKLCEHVDKSPGKITEEELREYFLHLKNEHAFSASSMKVAYCGVKFFFTFTLKRKWSTLALVRARKETRLPVVLEVEEVRRIIRTADALHNRAFFWTAYSCGLRLQEALNLQVKDVDGGRMMLHVPELVAKLNRQGRIVLTIDAAKPDRDGESLWLLRDHIAGEVLLGLTARNIDAERLAERICEGASIGGPIAGTVSDGEKVIVDAVELALPGKPHQLCQYHFLVNFAKEVTVLDSRLKKALAGDLRGINLFENAARATPSKRPKETDIRGPASLALRAEPPKEERSKKGGADASTRGSCSRRAPKRRSSSAISAK